MTQGEHPEPSAVAATICAALNEPAIAVGLTAGQSSAQAGLVSVIFCSAPDTLSSSLRVLIDDETHGSDGPLCIDLTIEATLQPGLGWVVQRADVETVLVADAALAMGDPNLAARLTPESLAAVSLDSALSRVAELLARAAADA